MKSDLNIYLVLKSDVVYFLCFLVYLGNHVRRSRKLVRRLPFGRDTSGDMHFFLHIFNHICFELSTLLWTARGCVDGVRFYGRLRSESEFRHHLPVVLGYTISLSGRVSREQRGGAAKILSRIGLDHGS